jgi:circadian clock protein KaiC
MTAVMGAPGSGKTLIGLSFLAEGLRRGEPAVYLGFYETPDRLLDKASGVGLDLRAHAESGALRILWRQPAEQLLDEMAEALLAEIETAGASRVFVDGLDGMEEGAFCAERFGRHFVALSNELRALGVTTFVTKEIFVSGERLASASIPLSADMDNIILVRYLALRSQLHRLISVLKMRESHYDASVHEFDITSDGCVVADTSASAEVLLAELAAQHGRLVEAAHGGRSGAPEGNAAPGGEP